MTFRANCLATGIGSVPHLEAKEACRFVWERFPIIPFWPQLPKRSFRENMYAQYSERLPGLCVEGERVYLDKQKAYQEMEEFYDRYLSQDLSSFAIKSSYAAGLPEFLEMASKQPTFRALKGHVTGPISFGLQVTDENRRALIYDENLRDVVIKQISRKAQWQEQELKRLCTQTIIFFDEPYMSSFGSAFINLQREEVISILNEVFGAVEGLSAVHCCGNTDWSLLLQTNLKIINFDAFSYADNLLLYKDDLKRFLERGGIMAWGIIPTEADKILPKNDLFQNARDKFIRLSDNLGIALEIILRNSLITPACGVGSGSLENALQVFDAANWLSYALRSEFKLT